MSLALKNKNQQTEQIKLHIMNQTVLTPQEQVNDDDEAKRASRRSTMITTGDDANSTEEMAKLSTCLQMSSEHKFTKENVSFLISKSAVKMQTKIMVGAGKTLNESSKKEQQITICHCPKIKDENKPTVESKIQQVHSSTI